MMDWQKEDLKYIWHPCSQMKDYETLMAEKNEDLSYLCKYIKVFYFATEQKDNIVEFEIKEIEG